MIKIENDDGIFLEGYFLMNSEEQSLIYSLPEVEACIEKLQDSIDKKSFLGDFVKCYNELEQELDLKNVSHLVTKLEINGNSIHYIVKILPTLTGKNLLENWNHCSPIFRVFGKAIATEDRMKLLVANLNIKTLAFLYDKA